MFDDFETQIQIEEIIPEEYEDWLDSLIEEHAEAWLRTFAEEYAATWAPGGCEWDEDEGCLPLASKEDGFTLKEWEQAYQEFYDAVEEDEATTEFEPGRVYWDEMAANP